MLAAGWGIGLFYVAFFLFFLIAHLIGDGPDSGTPISLVERLMFVAIGVSCVGVLVSLWKRTLGAWLAIVGCLLLVGLDWHALINPFFPLPLLAGVLILIGNQRVVRAQACRE